MPRILLVTMGSLGDLHPYLAIAKVLLADGYQVRVATHTRYQEKVEGVGAEFLDLPPRDDEIPPQSEWIHKVNHPTKGSEFVIRQLVMPFLEPAYRTLLEASQDCDLLVSHVLAFAVPLVAEKRRIPWVSCMLQPSVIFSAEEPPIFGALPFLPAVRRLGPWAVRSTYALMRAVSRSWFVPIAQLRQREGLPPASVHPLFNAFSPHGNWLLFPEIFSPPQPEWPALRSSLGFPLFDDDGRRGLPEAVTEFLAAGDAPVVFTLGSAVSESETPFFADAYAAIRATGGRAIFVAGEKQLGVPAEARRDANLWVTDYAPYSALFPRAQAVVHQCGIGTTAQGLASGRPQLLVPFAHDQPDNAARVARLGAGIVVPSGQLGTGKLTDALRQLRKNPRYAECAVAVGKQVNDGQFASRLRAAAASLCGKNPIRLT